MDPEKLHVRFDGVLSDVIALPRCYTLTHSDRTGDLYLTIGSDFNHKQISGLYTRLMRDEVLAEWRMEQDLFFLHVCCHVCGGFVFGTASMRESIFRHELPLVLEAFAYGDREMVDKTPRLRDAKVFVHFGKTKPSECKIESWRHAGDYSPLIEQLPRLILLIINRLLLTPLTI